MNKLKTFLFTVLASAIAFSCAEVEVAEDDGWEDLEIRTEYKAIKVEKVATGLERPWSLAFLSEDRMLVTERPGRLNLIENGEVTEIEGTPEVMARNQGGMLEVSVHPNYEENGWIYLTYSKANGDDTALTVARGRLDGNSFVDIEEIFVQNQYSSPGRHYGSKIAWDNEGYMYVSIGDRGTNPPRAQDNSDHAGTLLRLNDDGTVPDDNPFVNDDNVANEIFSYGHRNIQGLIINQENNEIWATEHGPRGGDELNIVEATKNYGWPDASYGRAYGNEREFHDGTEARSLEGMEDPVYEILPTHAPSGLALVTSEHFSEWEGNLLAGGLRSERIRRLVIEDRTVVHDEELLTFELGRIRDVRQGPDGMIYVVTDEDPGGVYRIVPNED
ncbi:MAG: PQQ-dependent sugar dehydrogenase [Balneolaceae bacterium]|nr:PQQ-dependent sugar dehydrogenase [Balneolaceae bacterium]MCH8547397.1 PQQ-dependent sugar dehydrogenase [Balneolaceae bacterium]